MSGADVVPIYDALNTNYWKHSHGIVSQSLQGKYYQNTFQAQWDIGDTEKVVIINNPKYPGIFDIKIYFRSDVASSPLINYLTRYLNERGARLTYPVHIKQITEDSSDLHAILRFLKLTLAEISLAIQKTISATSRHGVVHRVYNSLSAPVMFSSCWYNVKPVIIASEASSDIPSALVVQRTTSDLSSISELGGEASPRTRARALA